MVTLKSLDGCGLGRLPFVLFNVKLYQFKTHASISDYGTVSTISIFLYISCDWENIIIIITPKLVLK